MYQVQMYYKDKEQLNIDIPKESINNFFNDLNHSQAFIHPVTKVGFWTNLQEIRYIRVIDRGLTNDQAVKATDESSELIQGGDEDPETGTEVTG